MPQTSTEQVTSKRSGPLAGVRVLDLTALVMGPYCTQILADYGADVIKVESAEGDPVRYLPGNREPQLSGAFLNLNRGKRGIVIDLKSAEGRAVLLRLVQNSDVFLHSMRAGAIQRLGLTYADIAAVNPRIIYASLYGFSRRGPYADFAAYDDIIQAASGIPMLQQQLTGEANYVATVLADKVSGMAGLHAVLMALFHRERTGEGQELETTMFETMVSFNLVEHIGGAAFVPPTGPPVYQRVVSRDRRPYRTRDGYISVMAYNDKQWGKFLELIDNPEWGRDPRFATYASRLQNIDEVCRRVGERLTERTTAEWIECLRAADIPAMPLLSIADVLADPHLEATGFFQELDTSHGKLRFPGMPSWFSKTPGQITSPGPRLGEHSVEVLREHGFAPQDIDALIAAGVVR